MNLPPSRQRLLDSALERATAGQDVALVDTPGAAARELAARIPGASVVDIADHGALTLAPLDLEECLDLLGVVELPPDLSSFASIWSWAPEVLHATRRSFELYGAHLLSARPDLLDAHLEALTPNVLAWFERRSASQQDALALLTVIGDTLPIALAIELIGAPALTDLIELGCARVRGEDFEPNAFITWSLKRHIPHSTLAQATHTLAAHIMPHRRAWPEYWARGWSEAPSFLQRYISARSLLEHIQSHCAPEAMSDEALDDALWASSALGMVRSHQGKSAATNNAEAIIEHARSRPSANPDALAIALLLNARAYIKDNATSRADVLDEAATLAHQNHELLTHIDYARGVLALQRRDHDAATRQLQRSRAQTHAPSIAILATIRLGRLTTPTDRAIALLDDAIDMATRHGLIYPELLARKERAQLERVSGRVELAHMQMRYIEQALTRHDLGRAFATVFRTFYGRLLADMGEPLLAVTCFEDALASCKGMDNWHAAGIAHIDLGFTYKAVEAFDLAHAHFEHANSMFARTGHHDLQWAAKTANHQMLIEKTEGSTEQPRHIQRATELLASIDALSKNTPALKNSTILTTSIARLRRTLLRYTEEARASVCRDGTFFITTTRERVDTATRRALRGILAALASADSPTDTEELIAAGWPGETITPESGQNRVRVAISTLRKLGLDDAIRFEKSEGSGYVLDAQIIEPE